MVPLPPASLDLLLQESIRQHQNLAETKDSLDTRASFMLGLLGVILTVFAAVFSTYWTGDFSAQVAREDSRGWLLSLTLSGGTIVSIALALCLEVWVLTPKKFAAGVDLSDAYKYAVNPEHGSEDLEDQVLRATISSTLRNLRTYSRNVEVYEIASLVTVTSLLYSADFIAVLMGIRAISDPGFRDIIWLLLGTLVPVIAVAAAYFAHRIHVKTREILQGVTLNLTSLRDTLKGLDGKQTNSRGSDPGDEDARRERASKGPD